MTDHTVTTVDALYEIYKQPNEKVQRKVLSALDSHCRDFISNCPFLVIGTHGIDGGTDTSPRGDAPGFIDVLDDTTLLLPDRPGNNRLDTLRNIVVNPAVGLLFMIPGLRETLRINGKAAISTDPQLLARGVAQGKTPVTTLKIDVTEAYLHCGKALIRSRLWDPAARLDVNALPSPAKIYADQIGGLNTAEMQQVLDTSYTETLY
ncbi:pyridoxamine 5'-phosphate oxidase family protein [Sneathiella marina]|uniref:Pyridoxamine 5'-phosphate oxidase family protein n=1 Tax=Sneathiella marina TaxID=2950108 RepID=A0ABY4W5N0_9PROT|nr:pyridoxamine 5'-phosphate oxidase family protein [Sneathiella marina]USG61418.1 pyridoxamine 5'-phosphate oxidase family protein [Sneathiella marina]